MKHGSLMQSPAKEPKIKLNKVDPSEEKLAEVFDNYKGQVMKELK